MFVVTFESGEVMEEYGDNVADVQAFISRSFSHMGKVVSIKPL